MIAPKSSPRPSAKLRPRADKIPTELRKRRQWLMWRYELDEDGRWWTKRPFTTSGAWASTTNSATWTTFEGAIAAFETHRFDGIGFVTIASDPYTLIDLDHVVEIDMDARTIQYESWAKEIVEAALQDGAYVEFSPSGTGVHIIGRGKGATGKRNDAEAYIHARFFTISWSIYSLPKRLGTLKMTLPLVMSRIGVPIRVPGRAGPRNGSPEKSSPTRPYVSTWTDQDILRLALASKNGKKLKRLLEGDVDDYVVGDEGPSRAELACAALLSFWFWLDPIAIERVMRNSDLYREKWDSMRGDKTYIQYTIAKALQGCVSYYGQPRDLSMLGAQGWASI